MFTTNLKKIIPRKLRTLLAITFCISLGAQPAIANDPSLYLLCVGAEPWLQKEGKRDLYGQDAVFVAKAFSAAHPFYKAVHSKVLTEKKATPKRVIDSLSWMAEKMQKNDVAIVFFSTHGTFDKKNGFYVDLYAEDPKQVSSKLFARDLNPALAKIKGKVILFIDSCEAGGILNPLSHAKNNTTFLLASKTTESSYGQSSSKTRPHGHFVAAMCEGLRGLADQNKDGIVTLGELSQFMPAHTKKLEKEQTCVFQIKQEHKNIQITKVDKHALAHLYQKKLTSRNPFGLKDIIIPRGFTAAKNLAKTTKFSSSPKDPNASNWNKSGNIKKASSIDGKWQCRWNDSSDPNSWNTCKADIKTVDKQIFIQVQDGSYRYLMALPQLPIGKTLEGAYIDQKTPSDINPFIAKVYNNRRIDGRWNGGRWDFKR